MATLSDTVCIVTGAGVTGHVFRAADGRLARHDTSIPEGAASYAATWTEAELERRIDEIIAK